MSDLTEFLLARIAEDRISADESQRDPWRVGHKSSCDWWGDMPGHCSCDATARAIAECEAKRRMISRSTDETGSAYGPDEYAELCDFAAVYSDHPDYRQEWRP